MTEPDGHVQELAHDEEGLEEEDSEPSDILLPNLVYDLVQQGVLNFSQLLSKRNSMRGCGTLKAMPLDIYSSIVLDMPLEHLVYECVISLSSRKRLRPT